MFFKTKQKKTRRIINENKNQCETKEENYDEQLMNERQSDQ